MEARGTPRLVSVIVPVRNGAATIAETLAGLAGQTYRGAWELIVVDNGSTDSTAQVVRDRSHGLRRVTVVEAPDRPGVAYARNTGAHAAQGDLIAYCDADDVPAPGWLAALVAAAPDCDLVGGRLDLTEVNPARVRQVHSEAGLPLRELQRPFGFLPYPPSGNIAVWADVLHAVGGWNESYNFGGEDAELGWRAQVRGFRLGFAPDAVVHFRLRSSLVGIARQGYRDGSTMPHLYRDFARSGMPRRSLARAAAAWLWLILASPLVIVPGRLRVTWVRRAAQHWGRVVGSIRYRVLFL